MSVAPKIFDFLYADHEKVASILAQLEEKGVPLETSINAQRSKESGLGLSAKVAGIGGELKNSRGLNYEVRQTFDPLWVNSRQLINLVGEDPCGEAPKLGDLEIYAGDLLAFDQSVLTKIMSSSSMRDFIAGGVSNEGDGGKKKTASEKKKEADVIQTYVTSLGLSIQFVLLSKNSGFWFNVNREYLYLHELDIPLKFPAIISGQWKVLGIVDAVPNDHFSLNHLESGNFNQHVPLMAHHLAELIGITGVQFGRRMDTFGLKPLVVYKELNVPNGLGERLKSV